jgi:hypothetical protein
MVTCEKSFFVENGNDERIESGRGVYKSDFLQKHFIAGLIFHICFVIPLIH